jgi:hypothetical protein
VIPLLAIYPKECKSWYNRDICTDIHCSTIHNSQAIETAQISYNWWMDQENMLYIYKGVLLSHKK